MRLPDYYVSVKHNSDISKIKLVSYDFSRSSLLGINDNLLQAWTPGHLISNIVVSGISDQTESENLCGPRNDFSQGPHTIISTQNQEDHILKVLNKHLFFALNCTKITYIKVDDSKNYLTWISTHRQFSSLILLNRSLYRTPRLQ